MGRYMEPDPIAMGGGFNGLHGPEWYGYANQNPLTYIDPWGLDAIRICLKQGTMTLSDDDGDVRMKANAWPGCGDKTKPGKYKAGRWQKDKTSPAYPNTKLPYSDPWWGWTSGYGPWFLPINRPNGSYTTTGIHGTWVFGRFPWSCSHGCVRLDNSDIEQLHQLLPKPQGTPIEIVADCGDDE